MSITTYDVKEPYTGDGTLNAYTFDFRITSKSHLEVVVVDSDGDEVERVRGTDLTYLTSVVFDATLGGGTVTLAANLPAGYQMFLLLANDEPLQSYEFRNKTSFTLRTFEAALDYLGSAIQRLVYKSKQSLRLHDSDNEVAFNPQFPPGIASKLRRVFAVNATGDGIMYGPTTLEIENAEAYATAAGVSAAAALVSETDAEAAAVEAGFLLFNGSLNIHFPDSPVTLTQATYVDKIVFVDATLGNIIINLEVIAGYPAAYKTQFIRSDDTANTVTIVPFGAETIDGEVSYLLPSGLTVILSVASASDWRKKFIGLVNAGASLPTPTVVGDYLETDGVDPIWQTGSFAGFSLRYGAALNLASLRDALLYVFNFGYLAPAISLSCSPSTAVREKGTSVATVTMSAVTTKNTDPITAVTHFRNGVLVDTEATPSATGGTETFTESTPFTDIMTFYSKVYDGTTLIQSNTVTYNYVYPYYSGAGAVALSAANVALLTKDVRVSTATLNKTFTTLAGQVYFFAYPASYGALTSILDENGFETFPDWTLRTENITGLDASAVSYRIYEFNNPVVAGSTNYTFIR